MSTPSWTFPPPPTPSHPYRLSWHPFWPPLPSFRVTSPLSSTKWNKKQSFADYTFKTDLKSSSFFFTTLPKSKPSSFLYANVETWWHYLDHGSGFLSSFFHSCLVIHSSYKSQSGISPHCLKLPKTSVDPRIQSKLMLVLASPQPQGELSLCSSLAEPPVTSLPCQVLFHFAAFSMTE